MFLVMDVTTRNGRDGEGSFVADWYCTFKCVCGAVGKLKRHTSGRRILRSNECLLILLV